MIDEGPLAHPKPRQRLIPAPWDPLDLFTLILPVLLLKLVFMPSADGEKRPGSPFGRQAGATKRATVGST